MLLGAIVAFLFLSPLVKVKAQVPQNQPNQGNTSGNLNTVSQTPLNVPLPGTNVTTVGAGIKTYITGLYKFGIGFGALLALLMIVVGATQYTLAAGNSPAQDAAKSRITEALWGLLLLISAGFILSNVNPKVFRLGSSTNSNNSNQQNGNNNPGSLSGVGPLTNLNNSAPNPSNAAVAPGSFIQNNPNIPNPDPNSIYFFWNDNSTNETGYEIREVGANPSSPSGELLITSVGPQPSGSAFSALPLSNLPPPVDPQAPRVFIIYAIGPNGVPVPATNIVTLPPQVP